MTTSVYETELERLGITYERAMKADIDRLKTAIAGASEFSVIGVGSGGSFTVASLLCNLHRDVYRPCVPAVDAARNHLQPDPGIGEPSLFGFR